MWNAVVLCEIKISNSAPIALVLSLPFLRVCSIITMVNRGVCQNHLAGTREDVE